ncbi:MAG TPA: hypothetical protein VKT30_09335 [Caulobacteraceae bacterium]|nr:hypothetical protein [Caulobacteraceae bacterium]
MAVRQLAQANDGAERLQVKSEVVPIARGAETPVERIRRLQWEASVLAAEQTEQFGADLAAMAQRAREIAEGGEVYPVGVREIAGRIAEDLQIKAKAVLTIQQRVGPGS